MQTHHILGQVVTSRSREVMLLLYAALLRPQLEDWQEKHQHTGANLGTDRQDTKGPVHTMCKERLREFGLFRLEKRWLQVVQGTNCLLQLSSGVYRRDRLRMVGGAQQKDSRQCSQVPAREIPTVR